MNYNEFEIDAPDEATLKDARRNIERSKMHVQDKAEWPAGAESDDKLYSLECSPAMRLVDWSEWEPVSAMESGFEREKPPLSRVEGTYAEVSAIANRLMRVQESNGAVIWVYTPALIEPQLAA
jgi:hypothetical protein